MLNDSQLRQFLMAELEKFHSKGMRKKKAAFNIGKQPDSNITLIIIIINVFISPVQIHNKHYREWSIQIMKIAQIIYNYYIKPDKTLGIYIVKLLSCIETLFY